MPPVNNHKSKGVEPLGRLLASLRTRVERLERQDNLSRVHPVTGSADFLGTVLRTPDGVPTLVVSQQSGVEIPGTSLFFRESSYVLDAGAAVDTWTTQQSWVLPECLADAVEVSGILTVTGPSVGVSGEGEVRLTAEKLRLSGSTLTSIQEETATPKSLLGTAVAERFVYRWGHGIGLFADADDYLQISLQTRRTISGSNVTITPSFAFLRGAPMIGATSGGLFY